MTKFYNNIANVKDIQELCEFIKVFEVTAIVGVFDTHSASTESNIIYITIDNGITLREIWSAALHELQHILCHRQGLYAKYHDMNAIYTTKGYPEYMLKYGLRAEVFVDKRAEVMMKAYFPSIPYKKGYGSKSSKKWYREWVLETFF